MNTYLAIATSVNLDYAACDLRDLTIANDNLLNLHHIRNTTAWFFVTQAYLQGLPLDAAQADIVCAWLAQDGTDACCVDCGKDDLAQCMCGPATSTSGVWAEGYVHDNYIRIDPDVTIYPDGLTFYEAAPDIADTARLATVPYTCDVFGVTFEMPICTRCGNGPLTGLELDSGLCRDCEPVNPARD